MSRKFRSWISFFVIVGIVFGLSYLGNISFKLPNIDFNFDFEKNNEILFTGIDELPGKLYITPFDSFDAFENSVSQTNDILYLQTYDFTEKRVKKMFRELLDRGGKIKLIMENKKYKQYKDSFKTIGNYFSKYTGFEIKSDENMGTNYVHSKIALFDDEFWVQTANLTYSSFFKNREHFFVSSHSGVYDSLKTVFEKDRNGEDILLEDLHPNLLVCNINCRSRIEKLLYSAEKSIVIQTQYIKDSNIRKIIGESVENGIHVKMLLADTDDNDVNLNYFSPEIARVLPKPVYNHTKMILIDNEILLIGSMNLSSNSLDNNREIGVLTKDVGVIDKFLKQFDEDWGDGVF